MAVGGIQNLLKKLLYGHSSQRNKTEAQVYIEVSSVQPYQSRHFSDGVQEGLGALDLMEKMFNISLIIDLWDFL